MQQGTQLAEPDWFRAAVAACWVLMGKSGPSTQIFPSRPSPLSSPSYHQFAPKDVFLAPTVWDGSPSTEGPLPSSPSASGVLEPVVQSREG